MPGPIEAPVALFPRNAPRPARKPRPEPPEQRIVGFGDDLPAFLARAPKVAAGA